MCDDLRRAILKNQPYLKSSVDDLESLYWVILWATVYNIYSQPSNTDWQNLLRGSIGDRQSVSKETARSYLRPSERSAPVCEFAPCFKSWITKLDELREDWNRLIDSSMTIPLQKGNFWPFQYHEFAYRGACDILEVVKQYRTELSRRSSFAQQLDDPSASSQHSSTKRGRDEEDDRPVSGKKQK